MHCAVLKKQWFSVWSWHSIPLKKCTIAGNDITHDMVVKWQGGFADRPLHCCPYMSLWSLDGLWNGSTHCSWFELNSSKKLQSHPLSLYFVRPWENVCHIEEVRFRLYLHVLQYTPRGFPTFRKTPRKIFRAENLSVFPKSVFLGMF